MSAQAGRLYFDRRPISSHDAALLSDRLVHRGPDGSGVHLEPGLAMVHCALHITPEDGTGDRQPYCDQRSIITWDGRLDNRSDLLLQLGLARASTDAQIVGQAYDRWGLDALPRLIGDWSCAIWDRRARHLHLASDYMGARMLYWRKTSEHFAWATTLEAFDPERLDINKDYLLGLLAFSTLRDQTPYKDVFALSPGLVLSCDATGVIARHRFYDFKPARIEYRRPESYDDQFRELFADAVGSRLRACNPVWAELSGGLDSSSIVCMASALMKQGRACPSSLHTASYIPDASPESSEERFIGAVTESTGLANLKILTSDHPDPPCADPVNLRHRGALTSVICRHMRQQGAHVLLSGKLGDEVTGHTDTDFPAVLEPLLRGRPIGFLASARQWSLASKRPLIEIVGTAARALGSGRNYGRMRFKELIDSLDPNASHHAATTFSLIDDIGQRFVDEITSYDMIAARIGPPWKHDVLQGICRVALRRSANSWTPSPTVHYTYPYTHRPLVEFVLAIPNHIVVAPGERRRLMRRALAGILPPAIRSRFSKGYAGPYLMRSFRSTAEDLLNRVDSLAVVHLGLIDAARLRDRLIKFRAGAAIERGNLWEIALIEDWFAKRANVNRHAKGGERHVIQHASAS